MVAARTVVVVHRERMVAEGIASGLARYPSVSASGSTAPSEVVRRADRVDAVALDAALEGADGWATRLRSRGVRVVLLGECSDEEGGVAVPTGEPVSALASALVPGIAPERGRRDLTRREGEVLSLVARGLAGKQVANHLGISPKTVERHKTRIFAKLGVVNQAAAVGVAVARREIEGPTAWT